MSRALGGGHWLPGCLAAWLERVRERADASIVHTLLLYALVLVLYGAVDANKHERVGAAKRDDALKGCRRSRLQAPVQPSRALQVGG